MHRYYFNIRDEYGTYADPEGSIFADIGAARAEAIRAADELSGTVPQFGSEAAILITSATGEIILTVPLSAGVWWRIGSQCLSWAKGQR
jgi:hypothetical protein